MEIRNLLWPAEPSSPARLMMNQALAKEWTRTHQLITLQTCTTYDMIIELLMSINNLMSFRSYYLISGSSFCVVALIVTKYWNVLI